MRAFTFCFGLSAIFLLMGCYSGTRPRNVGSVAPDFTVQDADHKMALSQFRGRVVVLNFWASYCAPCIAEMPSLMRMQARLKAKGVTVLAISVDDNEAAYDRFLKAYAINFLTVRDPSQRIEHLYGTSQIPDTYIIDRNGVLRRKFVNAVNWDTPEVTQYLSAF